MATVSWLAFRSTFSEGSSQCWTRLRSWPIPAAIRPHLWRAGLPPLAARPWENRVQDRCIDNVVHGLAPMYPGPFTLVADLPSRRSLRSVGTNRLVVPISRLSTVGSRALLVTGPQTWNDLPGRRDISRILATFRRLLKTHLLGSLFLTTSWTSTGCLLWT